jgi:hypothetical protein
MPATKPAPSTDAALGSVWFNSLTEYQRALWLLRAGSAIPADAWAVFKASLPQHPISKTAAQPRCERDRTASPHEPLGGSHGQP